MWYVKLLALGLKNITYFGSSFATSKWLPGSVSLLLSFMIYHSQWVKYTFYLGMTHFWTGSNEWMLVITSCTLIAPVVFFFFFSTIFIRCLQSISHCKNNSCKCCHVRDPSSSFFDPYSLALESSSPMLIEFFLSMTCIL